MWARLQIFWVLVIGLVSMESAHAVMNSLEWIEPQTSVRKRLNLESLFIEEQLPSNLWHKLKPFTVDGEELKTLLVRYNNSRYFFPNKQTIRFTIQGTGFVFDFNVATSQLKRIDQTIHSGHNFGAYQFYRKNILYSIGGEGMWSYNRQITYFDDKTREWEILRPKNLGPEAMANGFQGYSDAENAYFTGGGDQKNYLENERI
jgi:ribosomal protein L28